jgi:hypothetical protein
MIHQCATTEMELVINLIVARVTRVILELIATRGLVIRKLFFFDVTMIVKDIKYCKQRVRWVWIMCQV